MIYETYHDNLINLSRLFWRHHMVGPGGFSPPIWKLLELLGMIIGMVIPHIWKIWKSLGCLFPIYIYIYGKIYIWKNKTWKNKTWQPNHQPVKLPEPRLVTAPPRLDDAIDMPMPFFAQHIGKGRPRLRGEREGEMQRGFYMEVSTWIGVPENG